MQRSTGTIASLVLAALVAAAAVPATAGATDTGNMEAEIDFLVEEIGESDCTFIRNGNEHSAQDAADHLQMKRKRGRRYYDSTEEFIERIASMSSWTGRKYLIRCTDGDPVPSGRWLQERLAEFRADAGSNQDG